MSYKPPLETNLRKKYVTHTGKISFTRKKKICAKCNNEFYPTCSTQVYCGSKTKRMGCSWDMVAIRDKKRGKLPHRKTANLILQKEWKKKQRRENTPYSQRQKILKSKHWKTVNGRMQAKASYKRNIKTHTECNRRRELLKKNIIGSHKLIEWTELKEKYSNKCAICTQDGKLTRDHIIPISKGGTDFIWNIQPLCQSCNSRKHNKWDDQKIICVSGGMDCLHTGHIRYIQQASKYGKVVVILNTDEWLRRKKGYVFMDWKERGAILASFKGVHGIVMALDDDDTVCKTLEKLRPTYFGKGGDRTYENTPEVKTCERFGIKVIFGLGGEKIQSSSDLIKRAMQLYPNGFRGDNVHKDA